MAAWTLLVVLLHLPYLSLPLFWDEMGQFVPAALDLYREGRWVPHSTTPNVHPPGLMAYLAVVWSLFGYSIPATRAAMLVVAGITVFLTWRLARRLCAGLSGSPAWIATGLLIVSPLFYTQALLAQLDLPAAMLTLWALVEFLEERPRRSALVSVLLVLIKETGVAVALVLGAWLWREGRRREALWFLLPAAALVGWLAVLTAATGHWSGNPEFARYNVAYPLHPVRLALALLRRAFYLFVDQFHFLGWIAIWRAWRGGGLYRERAWGVMEALAVVHTLTVTVLGGATLERYLLPVLPLMYIAMAAGWAVYSQRARRLNLAAALGGLVVCLFWTRPLPSPLENNLAMVDFIRLGQQTAAYLEEHAAGRRVVTAWPLSEALRSADFGYVRRGLQVREIPDFSLQTLVGRKWEDADILVLYRRDWNPGPLFEWLPALQRFRERFYGFGGEISPEEAAQRLKWEVAASWRRT